MQRLGRFLRNQSTFLALAAALLLCTVAWRTERQLVGEWCFPLDDTWIHCQIARNLAQGHGWSYATAAGVDPFAPLPAFKAGRL